MLGQLTDALWLGKEDRDGPHVAYPNYVEYRFDPCSFIAEVTLSSMRHYEDDSYISIGFDTVIIQDERGVEQKISVQNRDGRGIGVLRPKIAYNACSYVSVQWTTNHAAAYAVVNFDFWEGVV